MLYIYTYIFMYMCVYIYAQKYVIEIFLLYVFFFLIKNCVFLQSLKSHPISFSCHKDKNVQV